MTVRKWGVEGGREKGGNREKSRGREGGRESVESP